MAQAPAKRGATTAAAARTAPEPLSSPDMTAGEPARRRGRPKGTGIDDAATLAAIADLMAADPDLKPTTAIKKVGVTDPSIVRRLREKLKAPGDAAIPSVAKVTRPTPQPRPSKPAIAPAAKTKPHATTPQAIALAAALADAVAQRASKPPAAKPDAKAAPRADIAMRDQEPAQPAPASKPTVEPVFSQGESAAGSTAMTPGVEGVPSPDMLRASVEAATAITRLQMQLFEEMLRMSVLSKILKQLEPSLLGLAQALAAEHDTGPRD
jgi:hypothetical protein